MTKKIMLIMARLTLLLFLSGCVGMGPLSKAAVDNDIEKIKTLVAEGTDVNELDKTAYIYFTPLWCAVDSRNQEAVKTLLELGADPNGKSSYYGYSQSSNSYGYTSVGSYRFVGGPLMAAVLEEDIVIVEMLLKAGADPKAIAEEAPVESSPGMDPLGYAAMNGNLDVAKLLLSYGADANLKYPNNAKAAYEAVHRGYFDYAVLMIKNGFEIESDPEYVHYNAELAHLAADQYAQDNEAKSLQLYKQAIELYPQGVKMYESIAARYRLKENAKAALTVLASVIGPHLAKTQANIMAQDTGYGVATYQFGFYKRDMSISEFYQKKAETSEENYSICNKILNCYEKNKPDTTLGDCIEKSVVTLKLDQN